ncbi:MAG: VOC family protein [Chitinophagaceae bacterium]|nr:VOC family protein [Chitinophagaceae bacterium]
MRKLTILIVILFSAEFLQAQDLPAFNFAIEHMAFSVKDVDRSAEFYKNVLKLREITNRSKLDGVRWFSLAEGKELHLIAILKEKVAINKSVHLALTTPQFDAFTERLDKMKIPYSDWPGADHKINIRADGIKQIFFQDPDGYWIEINSTAQN